MELGAVPFVPETTRHRIPQNSKLLVNSLLTMNGLSLSYQEKLRRDKILALIASKDYLMVMASQQQKSVEQVKYELYLELKKL